MIVNIAIVHNKENAMNKGLRRNTGPGWILAALPMTLAGCGVVDPSSFQEEQRPGVDPQSVAATTPQGEVTVRIHSTPFFVPPHVGGDQEFNGHGPYVYCSVSIDVHSGNQIWARVYMQAIETTRDYTHAEGSTDYHVYTSESPIRSILSATYGEFSYTDNNVERDFFQFPSDNLMSSLVFMGDALGDDAGIHTGVQVGFHPVRLLVE